MFAFSMFASGSRNFVPIVQELYFWYSLWNPAPASAICALIRNEPPFHPAAFALYWIGSDFAGTAGGSKDSAFPTARFAADENPRYG